MNMFKKLAIFCLMAFLATGCDYSTLDDPGYVIIPMKSDISLKEKKEFLYPQFFEESPGPTFASADKLFRDLIHSQDAEHYKVDYKRVETRNKTLEGDSWVFNFSDSEQKNLKPSLYLYYFVCKGPKATSSCKDRLCSVFTSIEQMQSIKCEFGDYIAAFKSNDSGSELQYVCRGIDGPNNMYVMIRISDDLYSPSISKEELITRIQSLKKEDIFTNELVRCRVDEDYKGLDLQFVTTVVSKDNLQNDCETCETLLEKNKTVTHVKVQSTDEVDNLKLVVSRPLVSQTIQETTCSLKAMKDLNLCLGSQSFIPGENVIVSIQDPNGHPIENYEFCPNPLLAKSIQGDGQITAEIYDKNFFLLKGNLREKLCIEIVSNNRCQSSKVDFTNQDMYILIAPVLEDIEGGVAQVKFTRESGEVLKLALPWGTNRDYMLERLPKIETNHI